MKRNYNEITKDILISLNIAGTFFIESMRPYLKISLTREILSKKKYIDKYEQVEEKKVSRSIDNLEKNKVIIIKRKNNGFLIELTGKGKKIIKEIQFDRMKIKSTKKWDGKWRIIIFDIPEIKMSYARDALRKKLIQLNFYQIQKSVWAHPYPCQQEIQIISEILKVSPFVNIMRVDKMYNDDLLREHFKNLGLIK